MFSSVGVDPRPLTRDTLLNIMHYVYILKSKKDRKLYIGQTLDLENRFKEHSNGDVRSTKYRRPLELIYYESYIKSEDAIAREKKLKEFKSAYRELKKRLDSSLI